MSLHEYRTRTKQGNFQEAYANLEQNTTKYTTSSGIPESVNVNQLEESITEILTDINVNVASRLS